MTGGVLAHRTSDAAICLLGATLPLYHPMRVAEEMAVIDCMSGGRLIAGFPVGSAMDTTGVVGIPPTQVRPRYYEAHDLIKQAWTRPGPFPFNGEYTKQRYVNPWPQPLQDPHPPIWLAGGGSVETYHFAAQNDYTYSYLSFAGYIAAQALLDGYWRVVESYDLDDNPYRAGYAQLICVADTDEQAKELYWPHMRNFVTKSLYVGQHFGMVPGYMTQNSMKIMLEKTGSATPFRNDLWGPDATYEQLVEAGVFIAGSPDTVAQRLEEAARGLRVGHVIAILQIQSMEPELTKYNTRLFGEKVLPRVRTIWDAEGYEDRWWPTGATRYADGKTAVGVTAGGAGA
jgi:alkanesulfonate monooxygenase SsuD/methylene tetrahydromethanopterin reductase-like flavin-dependent oxidoreductase (luciferase family)